MCQEKTSQYLYKLLGKRMTCSRKLREDSNKHIPSLSFASSYHLAFRGRCREQQRERGKKKTNSSGVSLEGLCNLPGRRHPTTKRRGKRRGQRNSAWLVSRTTDGHPLLSSVYCFAKRWTAAEDTSHFRHSICGNASRGCAPHCAPP